MKNVELVTLKAAHTHLTKQGKGKSGGFVSFHDMKELITANKPKHQGQGWTFLGSKSDWNRAVAPYYS